MIALAMIVVGLVYLGVSLVVVNLAVSYARKHNKSAKRWGWSAVLVMYLIPFWDWIPTVAVHQYYCATEAGFWVYKTPEQWTKENPGAMETLTLNKGDPSIRNGNMQNYADTYFVNQRFNLIVRHNGQFRFNRWRHEREVFDVKAKEVLARYVDFSTAQEQRSAGWSGWKFWLDNRHCIGGRDRQVDFGKFYLQFKGAEK